MRGLACLLMFQTHCYDSWLSPQARQSTFFMYSQLLGTLPAPLFLFLAGISFALVTDKLRQKDLAAGRVARSTIRRGAEVLGFGLVFRLQQWLFGWGWSPWTDLLRVDILNTIGVSMMLMGVLCWVAALIALPRQGRNRRAPIADARDVVADGHASTVAIELNAYPPAAAAWAPRLRTTTVVLASLAAVAVSLATPPLWTTYRPRFLPWPIESYVNGIHVFREPKGWFFPVFPWAGFALAGLATGLVLLSDWAKRNGAFAFGAFGLAGAALMLFSRWLDHQSVQLYAVYSYWTTSPEFFLFRVGLLLVVLFAVYGWCRWGAARLGWSPLVQLGQTSLLVYWVHIEFVYGRLKILPSHANSIGRASFGLAYITVFMLVLSSLRTRLKGRGHMTRLRSAGRAIATN